MGERPSERRFEQRFFTVCGFGLGLGVGGSQNWSGWQYLIAFGVVAFLAVLITVVEIIRERHPSE